MIGLIIFVIGAFSLWLLFVSDFNQRLKIIISLSLLVILIAGVWYENYGETPKYGVINEEQVVTCGVTAEYSYRSNFKIDYCLKNNSKVATIRRLELKFIVLDCSVELCNEIESVIKDLNFEIEPEQYVKGNVSLAFDSVSQNQQNLEWKVEVVSVKAVK